ncbi:hypothetical protein [Nonomuraea sp. NPDC048826]|uniref:hypothetical protein n=1 Tax=Nonomuraea sp. NPDC048826 TaxID=3364347 RepID=UPI003724997B
MRRHGRTVTAYVVEFALDRASADLAALKREAERRGAPEGLTYRRLEPIFRDLGVVG